MYPQIKVLIINTITMERRYFNRGALICTLLIFLFSFNTSAQVGINNPNPADASILDITSSDKGVLVPRVNIENLATIAPVTGGSTTSLLVYNSNPDTGPGFFYWSGSRWIGIDSERDWKLEGNGSTSPGTGANQNYLGTSDAKDLLVATNAIERMLIKADGRVSINGGPLYTNDRFTSLAENGERAVSGYSYGADGVGVYGFNSGTGNGVVGESTEGTGVRGVSSSGDATGIYGLNIVTMGTGVVGAGNGQGGFILDVGSGGAFTGATVGSVGFGRTASNGVGVAGVGNNLGDVVTLGNQGAGGSFRGNHWGVTSVADYQGTNNSVNRAAFIGRYVSGGSTVSTVYVGARIGNVNYKILGPNAASVSTTMKTSQGERILFAPEAPENWFFDIGEVQLHNGKAVVHLDKIFTEVISDAKPFKVFVQGSEGALGAIRITRNIKNNSFLVEDLGGQSNGMVQYSIYAIWKGKENLRFPEYKREEMPTTHKLSNEHQNSSIQENKKQ